MLCIVVCRVFPSPCLRREEDRRIRNFVLALHHGEKDVTSLLFHSFEVLLCGVVFFLMSILVLKNGNRNDLKFFLFNFGELS